MTDPTQSPEYLGASISGIFPMSKDVKLSDERIITIRPFTFMQMPGAARCLQVVGGAISIIDVIGTVTALVEAGEPAVTLVQMATRMKPEEMEQLQQDDGIHLLVAIIEVNADFFARRVISALTSLMIAATKALTPDPGEKPAFQDMTAAAETAPDMTAGPSVPLH